jgi:hypothetical protein
MKQDLPESAASQLMSQFAESTGLSSANPPRRYLWTDAFAVCNLLGLHAESGDALYRDLAVQLIDQVHHVLGRHREDDPRHGWISGLDEEEGERHPTAAGLRIGKELNERRPGERYDPLLEWDRDGQYFHYLTKWMHALNRASRATADGVYHLWALELARAAHAAFTYRAPGGGPRRMYWKMSIDLSYPLVPSMGQHDPLDGLVTYWELQAAEPPGPRLDSVEDLAAEIQEMERICQGRDWTTDDSLGIGGLLSDAYRVAQLMLIEDRLHGWLLPTLLDASLHSLRMYARRDELRLPASYRLAFRELGLSLGLRAVSRLQALVAEQPEVFVGWVRLDSHVGALLKYLPLADDIDGFWLHPSHQETPSWMAHKDINMVMLATSLAPDGYLTI